MDLAAPSVPQNRAGSYWFLAICTLCALIGRAAFLKYPFLVDSGVFVYTGKVVADGQHLYRDFFDTKFPGVGLFMAFPWRLFGNHWFPYIVVQTLASLGGAAMLARTATRRIGAHATIPTAVATLVYLNFVPFVFGGFQLETIQSFFSIIAACAAIEALSENDWRDSLLAGLAAGVAAMLKPTGLAVVGAFALAALFHWRALGARNVLRHAFAVAVGVLIPTLGTLAWIVRSGTWGDMPALLHQISLYGSQSPFDVFELTKPLIVMFFAAFPVFVRYWIFRRGESIATARVPRPAGPLVFFAVAWAILEMIGIVMQARMYAYHFLVFAAPAALLYGMLPRSQRTAPMALGFAPLLIWSLCYSIPDTAHVVAAGFGPSPVSRYLAAHTTAGDSIWADQVSRYVIETDRPQGSRYPHAFFWVNYDDAPQDYCRVLLQDFAQRRPKYIVLEKKLDRWIDGAAEGVTGLALRPQRAQNFRAAWTDLRQYVSENYQLETEIGSQAIWVRKTSSAQVTASAHD
jgi:hypothetical protein